MLKKKNYMKTLLAFVFSIALCCANFLGLSMGQTGHVRAINLGTGEGETWTYTEGVLTLTNITYEDAVILDKNTQIVFEGTNTIEGDGAYAIYLTGFALSFAGSGEGTLTIGDDTFPIFDSVTADINIGDLTCTGWVEGEDTTFTNTIPGDEAITLTKLMLTSTASGGNEEPEEHIHAWKYTGDGAVLKASCDCEVDASEMTATLIVSNVVAGNTPSPSLELGSKWSDTGLDLQLTNENLKYYTATGEGLTEKANETALNETPNTAGHYVAVATFDNGAGGETSIEKAFSITALTASVTPFDETVTMEYRELNNGAIRAASLFNPENCDGLTISYYLVGASGDTEINGESYYISVGTYEFKAVVSAGETVVAEAQTIVIVEKSTPNFTVTYAKWEYGSAPTPRVDGFVREDLLRYTYFYDAEHTEPVGGIPTEIRTYYVLIEFDGTDTIKAGSTTSTCTIVKKAVEINWPNVTVVYNGTVQTVNATFKDIHNQDVSLVVTFDSEFKDAKTYTATADLPDDAKAYYEFELQSELTREYTIIPLEIVVKIENQTSYYQAPVKSLTAVYQGGNVPVNGEKPYILRCQVTEGSDMGAYEITGNPTNPNYKITFIDGIYYVKNRILTLSIEGWVYGNPNNPSSTAYYGKDKVIYHYYSYASGERTTTKPTEPGRYRLEAQILDDEEYYCTYSERGVEFSIAKIKVREPKLDETRYVYDGSAKTYTIETQPTYKVEDSTQTQAGTYKVKITLLDPAHYSWEGAPQLATIEYVFVINKKAIEKPERDNRVFKYTGNNLEYNVSESINYLVEGNLQSEVGVHVVKITLSDTRNTCWSDGSSSELNYSFVINQADITTPNTTNANGEVISSKPVIVVDAGEYGIDPNATLNVVEINQRDKEQINSALKTLKSELKNYDSIYKIYDVSLKKGNVVLQPNGLITLKIAVPKELLNTEFKVYHIHTEESGKKTAEIIEVSGASELGYITVQVDKLSDFVFVYEQNSLTPLIVTFACLLVALASLLAFEIYWFLKQTGKIKSKTNTTMLAAVPAMFVGAEVAWSIILGILLVAVLAGNITLLVLIIKDKKAKQQKEKQKESETPSSAVDMSKKQKSTGEKKAKKKVEVNKESKPKAEKNKKAEPAKKSEKETRSLDLTKKK